MGTGGKHQWFSFQCVAVSLSSLLADKISLVLGRVQRCRAYCLHLVDHLNWKFKYSRGTEHFTVHVQLRSGLQMSLRSEAKTYWFLSLESDGCKRVSGVKGLCCK